MNGKKCTFAKIRKIWQNIQSLSNTTLQRGCIAVNVSNFQKPFHRVRPRTNFLQTYEKLSNSYLKTEPKIYGNFTLVILSSDATSQ